MYCSCKYKFNFICGICKKPFKISSNIEERIKELEYIIKKNLIVNDYYKIEIQDLKNKINK